MLDEKKPLPTSARVAFTRLRADILRGVLPPSERLRVNDVAERYGCGPIPTREALNRLAAERLVLYSEQRGFSVAPISRQDLLDLTRARSMLVEVATREAILKGDAAWEERVLVSYHRLSKVPRYLSLQPPTPNPDYDGPHREFHAALIAGCGSEWMVRLFEQLFEHAERYRNLSRKLNVAPREGEHRKILEATLSRRLDEAITLSKRHVEMTAEIIFEQPDGDS